MNLSAPVAILFTFALHAPLRAQVTFLKTYEADTLHLLYSIGAAQDGGYVLAGVHHDTIPTAGLALTKVDAQGGLVWSKRYAPVSFQDVPRILALSAGGMLALSTTYPTRDVLLLRLDDLGDTLWTRVLDHPIPSQARNAIELPGGEIIVASFTHQRIYLTRIDDLGNVVWSKGYMGGFLPAATLSDARVGIHLTSDGDLIIAGSLLTNGPLESNGLILKTDVDGNLLWGRFVGGDDEDNFRDVVETADSGYVAIGYHSATFSGQRQMLAVRFDHDGSVLWQKLYPTIETTVCLILKNSADGNPVIGGSILNGADGPQGLLFKIDDQGDVTWSNAYGPNVMFSDAVRVNAGLALAAMKNTGLTASSRAELMLQDTIGAAPCTITPYPLAAVDVTLSQSTVVNTVAGIAGTSSAITLSPLPLFEYTECISTEVVAVERARVELYPNPSDERCFVRVGDGRRVLRVEILDAYGRAVRNAIPAPSGGVDVSTLSAGAYVLRAHLSDGQIAIRSLAIE